MRKSHAIKTKRFEISRVAILITESLKLDRGQKRSM